MSATDELRKILDERGVEWEEATDSMGKVETWWHSSVFGTDVIAALGEEVGSVELDIPTCVTPEQAVMATMGDDTPVYLCPKCGVAYELNFIDKGFGKSNYCPHCGYRRLYV